MATKVTERPEAKAEYESDFYSWLNEQAVLLRAGRFAEVDVENVAEELEGMGRSEFSRLVAALRVLLVHMLKWDQQPGRRSRSWTFSIREQRRRYVDVLADNPGLKPKRDLALKRAYRSARDNAADETDLPVEDFPADCPYDWDDILNRPFETDSVPPRR